VTVGTSAAARVTLAENDIDDAMLQSMPFGLWCYRINRQEILLGGALTDGGSVFEWLCSMLNLDGEGGAAQQKKKEAVLIEAAAPEAGLHGLVFLPFLSGERAPGWNDNAQATISGITRNTRPAHLIRAGMEAVALRIAAVLNLMRPFVPEDAIIVASGTALHASSLWRQILADATGRRVIMEAEGEATSRGVAMLIARTVQTSSELKLISEDERCPDPTAEKRLGRAAQRQQWLYNSVLINQT
jgi:gluconokinase